MTSACDGAPGATGIACDAETPARPSPSAKTDAASSFMENPLSWLGSRKRLPLTREMWRTCYSIVLTSSGGASSDGASAGDASPSDGGDSPTNGGGGASPSAGGDSPNGGGP